MSSLPRQQQEQQQGLRLIGSRDGDGAGDHDQPYRFGRRPRASVPYPFNTRQYARLLVFRGRVQDSLAIDRGLRLIHADDAIWRPEAA